MCSLLSNSEKRGSDKALYQEVGLPMCEAFEAYDKVSNSEEPAEDMLEVHLCHLCEFAGTL